MSWLIAERLPEFQMITRGLTQYAPGEVPTDPRGVAVPAPFQVALDVFDGPFSLLLQLIQKHELDITDVSLSLVTDEFMTYLAEFDDHSELGLERASEFLEVAATLLDLKIARLLPQGEPVDSEDVAVFEARDLLFARLLQYRAFSQISEWFGEKLTTEARRHTREVPLDPQYRSTSTELKWTLTLQDFADLAAANLVTKAEPKVELAHLHVTPVSLREQTEKVISLLQEKNELTFADITAHAHNTRMVVARFLALLELYRRDAVRLSQTDPLGEIHVSWAAATWSESEIASLGVHIE